MLRLWLQRWWVGVLIQRGEEEPQVHVVVRRHMLVVQTARGVPFFFFPVGSSPVVVVHDQANVEAVLRALVAQQAGVGMGMVVVMVVAVVVVVVRE